jgi:hypothetical protein
MRELFNQLLDIILLLVFTNELVLLELWRGIKKLLSVQLLLPLLHP